MVRVRKTFTFLLLRHIGERKDKRIVQHIIAEK
jgi:hypothetical protein